MIENSKSYLYGNYEMRIQLGREKLLSNTYKGRKSIRD